MKTFKKDKYQLIRKAVSKEICNLVYQYLHMNAEADFWLLKNNITHKGNSLMGKFLLWKRKQALN